MFNRENKKDIENATNIFENTIIGTDRLIKSLSFKNE